MTREEANIKMQNAAMRELWLMEARGDMYEDGGPVSTKYFKGFLYVVWPEDHPSWCRNEAEFYDTANIYGECEDDVSLAEYKKMPPYTAWSMGDERPNGIFLDWISDR